MLGVSDCFPKSQKGSPPRLELWGSSRAVNCSTAVLSPPCIMNTLLDLSSGGTGLTETVASVAKECG